MTDPATRSKPERFHAAETISAGAAPQCLIPSEVYFGKVRIAPATIFAPMAGVTDTVFRRFIKYTSLSALGEGEVIAHSACGLIMTEFTSADGIYRTRETKRKRYLHFYEDEHPIS